MKFDLGPQEKFSLHQFLFVNTWWRICWRLWYRKVTVIGRKNIYTKKPLIITANHQNSAMDPLALVGVQTRQIVWLARADVFKGKVIRTILKFFKIMPIYRMRDGIDSLGNNEAIFKKSVEVLKNNKILALFPEAQHWGYRKLRATQKAAPRIAFMAEEMSNYELDTHILPVGLYYDNYVGYRRNLLVKIGEPYSIKEYVETYKENPNQAFIELRKRIEEEMLKNMMHINHKDEMYDGYEELRRICEPKAREHFNIKGRQEVAKYNAFNKVIEVLDKTNETSPETITQLTKDALEYKKQREKLNIREFMLANDGGDPFDIIWNSLKLFVGIPFFVIAFLTNYIKFTQTYKFAKKIAKDEQFHNSIGFVFAFLLVPISYIILACIIIPITGISWWYLIPICCALLFIAIIGYEYTVVAKKTYHMLRFNIKKQKKDADFLEVIEKRNNIINTFSKLL